MHRIGDFIGRSGSDELHVGQQKEFSYTNCLQDTVEFFKKFSKDLSLDSKRRIEILGWDKDKEGNFILPAVLKNPTYVRSRLEHKKMMTYLKKMVCKTHRLALAALELGNSQYAKMASEFKRQYLFFPIVEKKYARENRDIDAIYRIFETGFNVKWVKDRKSLIKELKRNTHFCEQVLDRGMFAHGSRQEISFYLQILESIEVSLRLESYELVMELKSILTPLQPEKATVKLESAIKQQLKRLKEQQKQHLDSSQTTPVPPLLLSQKRIRRSTSLSPKHSAPMIPMPRTSSNPQSIMEDFEGNASTSSELTSPSNESSSTQVSEEEGLFFLEEHEEKEVQKMPSHPLRVQHPFSRTAIDDYLAAIDKAGSPLSGSQIFRKFFESSPENTNEEKQSLSEVRNSSINFLFDQLLVERTEFYLRQLERKSVLKTLQESFSIYADFPLSNEAIIQWLGKNEQGNGHELDRKQSILRAKPSTELNSEEQNRRKIIIDQLERIRKKTKLFNDKK